MLHPSHSTGRLCQRDESQGEGDECVQQTPLMYKNPTWSPSLNPVTLEPIFSTYPQPSCPSVIGSELCSVGVRPWTAMMSEWHSDAALILTKISVSVGSGMGTSLTLISLVT